MYKHFNNENTEHLLVYSSPVVIPCMDQPPQYTLKMVTVCEPSTWFIFQYNNATSVWTAMKDFIWFCMVGN